MTSRERVLTALRCEIPDKVPYMYSMINPILQEKIVGEKLENYIYNLNFKPSIIVKPGEESQLEITYRIHPTTASKLGLDAIGFSIMPPLFCETMFKEKEGHQVSKGLIDSWETLEKIKMPDPDRVEVFREAEDFVKKYQGEFAIFCAIRMGVSPVLLSMGYDNFSYKLYEDKEMLNEVISMYTNWNKKVIKNILETGVDFLWSFDDLAYKAGPLFSPQTLNEFFIPKLKNVSNEINIPWIFHSDGNIQTIIDDLLYLGMNGIHPLEPGTMDLKYLKEKYGKRLCLIGNVDINRYLTNGTIEEIHEEVRKKIQLLGGEGGYIISDSNSVPYFCKPEKVIAMSNAVKKYRMIY